MKRLLFILFAFGTLLLSGCFETTQEITLNEDGSGTVSNTNDMSALIGMLKQMGGGADMDKMADQVMDSTFSLSAGADSIPKLTPAERELARKGTLHVNINMKEEKFLTQLTFPFKSPAEIDMYNKLSGKIITETMKSQAGGNDKMKEIPGGMPELSSLDDYYTYEFSNGELKKKLNKEKYADAANDKYLESMKEAGSMGLELKANYIINLPRPAKEVEGKGVKLSADKKKVTLTAGIDDFFDNPSLLEFKIKY